MKALWKQEINEQLSIIFKLCHLLTNDIRFSQQITRSAAEHASEALTGEMSASERKIALYKFIIPYLMPHNTGEKLEERIYQNQTDGTFFLYEKIKTFSDPHQCSPEKLLEILHRRYYIQAIQSIPFFHRLLLILKDIEDFSCEAIAAIVDKSNDEINRLINEARTAFKYELWLRCNNYFNRLKEKAGYANKKKRASNLQGHRYDKYTETV